MIVDESRRRNEEAVGRLREESRRRIERGRAAGPSHCMIGTMVALLMFVALESRRMHWAKAAPIAAQTRAGEACARFARRQAEIEAASRERIAAAFDLGEIGRIGARAAEESVIARRFAVEQGCDAAALAPPVLLEPRLPRLDRGSKRHDGCGGPPSHE